MLNTSADAYKRSVQHIHKSQINMQRTDCHRAAKLLHLLNWRWHCWKTSLVLVCQCIMRPVLLPHFIRNGAAIGQEPFGLQQILAGEGPTAHTGSIRT